MGALSPSALRQARKRMRQSGLNRQHQATREQNYDWDSFLVSVSCPPDTRIHITGGWNWETPSRGPGITWYVESQAFDLYLREVSITAINFTQPFWYIPVVASLRDGGSPDSGFQEEPLSIYGTNQATMAYYGGGLVEFETWLEAEQALDAMLNDAAGFLKPVICSLVLRNNGDVSFSNRIMPIDAVNRGRSYVFQDTRGTWTI